MQVEYIKCLAFDDRLLPNGHGQGHLTFLELVKLGTLNFLWWLIHKSTSERIAITPESMCDVSRDLLKVWETSGNISSTVQNTDIVAMEH